MKKYLFILIAFSLMTVVSCQNKIDNEKEKEAIIAVIEEERAAFFDLNIDRIEATWKQESTSRKIFMSAGGFSELNGWTEIYNNNKELTNEEFWKDRVDADGQYLNYDINVYGNTALVFHDAKFTGKYLGEEYYREQKRILHMVKVEGEWKLDLMAMYGIPEEEENIKEEINTE